MQFGSRREYSLIVLAAVVFAVIFSYPLIVNLPKVGDAWDWDYFLQLEWVPFWTVRHFHQFPLWNPYACGGMPMFANPQARVMSPFFLLHLALGPSAGIHLEIILQLATCFVGGYLLAKLEGLNLPGRIACAIVFPTSSWVSLHLAVGHLWSIAWLWLPWVAWFILLAVRNRALSWAVAGGLVAALMFGEGGVYQTSHAVLLASALCLALAIGRRSAWPLAVLATFGIFAAGFGAIKLLPAYRLLSLYPRPTDISYVDYSARSLPIAFFARDQFFGRESIGGAAFFEYGAYLSPFAAALAALGLATSVKRLWPWLAAALLFFVLAVGEGGLPQAWKLLHSIPPFSSERVTPRLLVPFVFTLGVFAGYGADFLCRRLRPWGALLTTFLIGAAVIDAWLVSTVNWPHVVDVDDPPTLASSEFRQFATGRPATNMYRLAKTNRGDPTCYEAIPVGSSVVGENQKGYRGEQYLLGRGSVLPLRWTPNALSFDVDLPAAEVMVVNQNYDAEWRITQGNGELFTQDGLMAVRLPAGKQKLRLAFCSRYFQAGAVITLLTCIAAVVVWRKEL